MPTTQNTVIDTVTFDKTQLCIIDHNSSPWITSTDLAIALGYEDKKSASRIYNRNKDEFSIEMATEVKLTSVDNKMRNKLIFSPRGCHLIAMFARTEKAKLFRKWVLDVLEHYQFGDGHGAPEPEYNSDHEYHMLIDTIPKILNIPTTFNSTDVPFTFVNKKLWLNSFDLGVLVGFDETVKRPGQKINQIYLKYKNCMPDGGSRVTTWSRVGRTTGERVYDLPTCLLIVDKCFDVDLEKVCTVENWLRSIQNHALIGQGETLNIDNSWRKKELIAEIKSLNSLMSTNELGDKAIVHQIIDKLIKKL